MRTGAFELWQLNTVVFRSTNWFLKDTRVYSLEMEFKYNTEQVTIKKESWKIPFIHVSENAFNFTFLKITIYCFYIYF